MKEQIEAAHKIIFDALISKEFVGYNANIRAKQLAECIITPSILSHPNDIDDIIFALNELKKSLIKS